ncbi:unnamed protein product [Schistosoma mattheei]|uniref:Uncharacterized protein n=1 Tax=Schistosoma mattheei TaxID=31246 RepID=A0A183NEK4_9TREM|nr:unnamed protein product [Schistosoma mattheei]
MTDFLFRTPGSYAILPELKPCPSGGLYFKFFTSTSTGLLLYTENNVTGQFFALTLLPNSRIKLELELRSPQYRITRSHTTITLDYSEKSKIDTYLNEMRSDATQRALFSAAMQPSFQGIVKDIYVIQCPTSYHSKIQIEMNSLKQCIPYEPIILENGALKIHSYSSSLNKLSHFCSPRNNPPNITHGLINGSSYFNLFQKQTPFVRCESKYYHYL